MRLAALAIVLASAPASAAPCSVTVARAPEGVREVIEHWVGAEPHCSATLEVRIVETEGGLYVIARDDRGRMHDRVVPDAQTAGVLVASWAADDTVTLDAPAIVAAPSMVDAQVDALPAAPVTSERRWIRLGYSGGLASAMLSANDNISYKLSSIGLRASAGVWSHGAWTVDASLDAVDSQPAIIGRPEGDLAVHEYTGVASLGFVLRSGAVSMTPAIGLGARYATYIYDVDPQHMSSASGLMAVAQGSLLFAVDLQSRWQLTAGMTAAFHPDPWVIRDNMELVWIGGVGWAM